MITVVTVLMLLFGCADNREMIQDRALKLALTTPHCYTDQECNDKWAAAKVWIEKNCSMEIKIANDSKIVTAKSPSKSSTLSVAVSKETFAGGKYKFIIKAWCDNTVGCTPDAYNSALNFNDFLNSVVAK